MAWDGWSAPARRFIESHGDALALRPVAERHADLVVQLNLWLYEQLADANAPALAEVNRLVVERNAILGGTDLEEARRVTEAWTRRRESPRPDPIVDITTLIPRRCWRQAWREYQSWFWRPLQPSLESACRGAVAGDIENVRNAASRLVEVHQHHLG